MRLLTFPSDEVDMIEEMGINKYGRRNFVGWKRGYFEYVDDENYLRRCVFVTMTSGGIKDEGGSFMDYFRSREAAEDALDDNIKEWIRPLKGYIHWRMLPEMREVTMYELENYESGPILRPKKLWVAYCRIAVDVFEPN